MKNKRFRLASRAESPSVQIYDVVANIFLDKEEEEEDDGGGGEGGGGGGGGDGERTPTAREEELDRTATPVNPYRYCLGQELCHFSGSSLFGNQFLASWKEITTSFVVSSSRL